MYGLCCGSKDDYYDASIKEEQRCRALVTERGDVTQTSYPGPFLRHCQPWPFRLGKLLVLRIKGHKYGVWDKLVTRLPMNLVSLKKIAFFVEKTSYTKPEKSS